MEIIKRNRARANELRSMTRLATTMLNQGMVPSEVEETLEILIQHRATTARETPPISTTTTEIKSSLRPNNLVPVYGPRRVFQREELADPWAVIADNQMRTDTRISRPRNKIGAFMDTAIDGAINKAANICQLGVNSALVRRCWIGGGSIGIAAMELLMRHDGVTINSFEGSLLVIFQLGFTIPIGSGLAAETFAYLKKLPKPDIAISS